MSSKEKIDVNRRMIGKEVLVVSEYPYRAIVIDVVNEVDLVVKRNDSKKIMTVSLFDVRSTED